MGKSLTRKIIEAHYVKGSMTPGEEVFIKVDQTLTHDINAVMTYLAFEAIGLPRVRTECSVSYLDHNLLYIDHKTPDDHIYLQSAARKFGVWVSRPGNGICHAVQVARFGAPGKISMGGDSHTPHGGAIGMLCIGVGGMDVATAMTGLPMQLKMPRVVNVRLTGTLRPGVNAKEVILEMLRCVTIKGGLGNVYEYTGPGVAALEVPQRTTIANMGAEAGQNIVVGASYTFSKTELPELLMRYNLRCPNVRFTVVTEPSNMLFRKVVDGEVDAAILRGDYEGPVKQTCIGADPGYLVTWKPLADAELQHTPRIEYKTNDRTLELLGSWWNEHYGTDLPAGYVDIALQLVDKGLGYLLCFLPQDYENPNDLCLTPLCRPDGTPLVRRIWLVRSEKVERKNETVREFVRYVEETLPPLFQL